VAAVCRMYENILLSMLLQYKQKDEELQGDAEKNSMKTTVLFLTTTYSEFTFSLFFSSYFFEPQSPQDAFCGMREISANDRDEVRGISAND
jgi:hypothetical protein